MDLIIKGGTIVTASDQYVGDIAIEGETALIVPADYAAALADAMARMASDAPLRERLGKRARRLVETKFSSETIGKQTVELYRSITPP